MGTANKTNITKRSDKSTALTHPELDSNFSELENVIDDSVNTETRLDNTTTGLNRRVIYVDTIADLQALPTADIPVGQIVNIQGTEVFWDGASYKTRGPVSAYSFGASPSATKAENKSAVQDAIAFADASGGGQVVIPANINYGYKRGGTDYHPDLTGVTTYVHVVDYSIGDTNPAPGQDGTQIREFFYTPGQEDGNTDANGRWVMGAWAPYLFINNTADLAPVGDASRTAMDNRRSTLFFARDGETMWGMGYGVGSGADYTDDELSNFRCVVNDLPSLGMTGLIKWLVVDKRNGNIGFHTDPQLRPDSVGYEFVQRPGMGSNFIIRNQDGDPIIRAIGTNGDVRFGPSASGATISSSSGDLYAASLSGAGHNMFSTSGSISLILNSQNTRRRILISDATSEFRIQNSAFTTTTLTHTDAGDLTITGIYSPFTGSHLFWSDEVIEVGKAVDYIGGGEVEVSTNEKDSIPLPGRVQVTTQSMSKVCAGTVHKCTPHGSGYIVSVAAVGDNHCGDLKGFVVNGENGTIEAGDILVTSSTPGELMKCPTDAGMSVVKFKALEVPDNDRKVYGYYM